MVCLIKKCMEPRDREAKEARMVQAVGTVLARDGFRGVGVNAVAREAGVNKVLIYRYFGGLEQLIAAYARSEDFWPTLEELAEGDPETFRELPVMERAVRFFRNYTRAIRRRPLSLEILAWESVEQNEITEQLEAARVELGEQIWTLFPGMESADLFPPALPVLLISAVQYLAVRSRTLQACSNLDIQSEEGWRQIEEAQEWMVRASLARAGIPDDSVVPAEDLPGQQSSASGGESPNQSNEGERR